MKALSTIVAAILLCALLPAAATIRTVTDFGDGGTNTLRGNIAAAAPGDSIKFLPGLGVVTISLTNHLVIDKNLTIIGNANNNLWIEGTAYRIFLVTNATVSISSLTLTNGNAGVNGNGGGILNYGSLTISSCTLTHCVADSGGCLYNAHGGVVTVNNCTLFFGGASAGGGIYNLGGLTLNNSSLINNFTPNTGTGGGVWNNASATVNGCTFSYNSAGTGGGVWTGGGVQTSANLSLANCTFYANYTTAVSDGGAIHAQGDCTLNHCTISGNQSTGDTGGISFASHNTYACYIQDSIVAGNSSSINHRDVAGAFTSQGYNYIGVTNDTSGWIASDHLGSESTPAGPVVGTLQDNGGPTWTMAPLPQTIGIIDRGTSGGLATDQRGKPRTYDSSDFLYQTNAPGGDGSDIGAVEINPPVIDSQPQPSYLCVLPGSNVTFTVTATGESPLIYFWLFNGALIPGATNASYALGPTNPPTPGDYSVLIEDDYFFYTVSDPAHLALGFSLAGNVNGGGSVLANPNQPAYCTNAPVTLTANHAAGWIFSQWSGDASGTNNPLIVVMNNNKVITANFLPQYSLTITTSGGGKVIRSPDEPLYLQNSGVTLTAVPAWGWAFDSWSGSVSGAVNPLKVLMTNNLSIQAHFTSAVPDLIVDNTNATFTGAWTTDAGTAGSGFFATDFRYATTVVSASAAATFQPNLPQPGNYDLYVWYPNLSPAGRRCSDAQYLISSSSGSQSVSVDQTHASQSWNLIAASTKFNPGTNGYVQLSNQSTDTANRWVAADAVRWVWSTNQVTQPYITSVTRAGSTVSLTWLSGSNQVYQLQYRTNLATGSWQALVPDVTATNSSATGTDSTLGNDRQRFYRVELIP